MVHFSIKIPVQNNTERLSTDKSYISLFNISSLETRFPIQSEDLCIKKLENDNDFINIIHALTDNENPKSYIDLFRKPISLNEDTR